jgi:cytochrome c-type biogenesis protein
LALALVLGWNWLRPVPVQHGLAPDFTLVDQRGEPVTLSKLQGQVVFLNFWATWCGPCVQELPELAAFHQAHPQIPLIGISVDAGKSTAFVQAFAKRHGATYTLVHDPQGQVQARYGVGTLPTTYVIDPKGHIALYQVGGVHKKQLERLLTRAQAANE